MGGRIMTAEKRDLKVGFAYHPSIIAEAIKEGVVDVGVYPVQELNPETGEDYTDWFLVYPDNPGLREHLKESLPGAQEIEEPLGDNIWELYLPFEDPNCPDHVGVLEALIAPGSRFVILQEDEAWGDHYLEEQEEED